MLPLVLDTNRAPHITFFLDFLQTCTHQRITLDQWDSFLQFQSTVNLDLTNYDEDGACKYYVLQHVLCTCFFRYFCYFHCIILCFYYIKIKLKLQITLNFSCLWHSQLIISIYFFCTYLIFSFSYFFTYLTVSFTAFFILQGLYC